MSAVWCVGGMGGGGGEGVGVGLTSLALVFLAFLVENGWWEGRCGGLVLALWFMEA